MTTSSENSVALETKAMRTKRLSRHKSRRRKRIAAKIVLILASVIGVWALADFAYHASARSGGYMIGEDNEVMLGGSGERIAAIALDDEPLRRDAAAVLLAAAILIGSTVISRRVRRHRR